MLFKILLVCIVIIFLGGMVYNANKVITNYSIPDVRDKGITGFILFSMAFFSWAGFSTFYLFLL